MDTVMLLENAQEKLESYKKIFAKKNSGAAGNVKVDGVKY